MSGASYVRFYPSDWRSGCFGMTLEEEGLYIRMCAYIGDTTRRIPTDDRIAAKHMGVHTNAYRKVRDQLAAAGKIKLHSDGWGIPRAERELAAALNACAVSSGKSGGQTNPNTGRETGQDTIGVTHPVSPPDTPQDTMGVFAKKTNEINTPLIEPDKNQNQKKEKQPSNPQDAAEQPAGWQELKSALNGSTEAMIADVQRFMGPIARRTDAVNWLTGTVSAFGSSRTAQAWTIVVAKMAKGELVPNPLPLWSRTAKGLRADDAQAAPAPAFKSFRQQDAEGARALLERQRAKAAAKELAS